MAKNVKLSSRSDDILLDWDQTQALAHGTCYLVALEDWQIGLLLSLIRYAEWRSRWTSVPQDFQTITDAISELKECLMAGCNVGMLIDVLDQGLATLHSDFETLNSKIDTLNGKMDTLASVGQGSGDLEDDLANIWRQVETITVVLGGAIAEAPIPL